MRYTRAYQKAALRTRGAALEYSTVTALLFIPPVGCGRVLNVYLDTFLGVDVPWVTNLTSSDRERVLTIGNGLSVP